MTKEIYYETTPGFLTQAWKVQWMRHYIDVPQYAEYSLFQSCEDATEFARKMQSSLKMDKAGNCISALCIERVFIIK